MAAAKKQVTVTKVRSANRRTKDQEATLLGLGLRKMRERRTLHDSPEIRGMIKKVRHLIDVEGLTEEDLR
jgi:large subunit ribosomal protein L30